MCHANNYIDIYKIRPCRNNFEIVDAFAWDTTAQTIYPFQDAKTRFTVPFEHADYIVFLYLDHYSKGTFHMVELGFRSLTRSLTQKKAA